MKAQRLALTSPGPTASPAQILTSIAGVQAQDLPAARLSIRARSTEITASDVETARQVDRSITWVWAMRGTLHLISSEDAGWLIPLLGPTFMAAGQRRLLQLGWDETRISAGFKLLESVLAEHGGLTRAEITRLLEDHHLPFEGQATIHLLYHASLSGLVCRGPDRENETLYLPYSSWLGKLSPLEHNAALAKLIHRYVEAYGPVQPEDFTAWSGLKTAEVRTVWHAIRHDLYQIETGGGPAWISRSHVPWLDEAEEATPGVRFLPRYDTYMLGYATRGLPVAGEYASRVHPGGGIIHPVLLVNGQAQATWKLIARKRYLEIEIEPFEPLDPALRPYIDAEVADIARFLGQKTTWTIPER
jgi:hypothetical protein